MSETVKAEVREAIWQEAWANFEAEMPAIRELEGVKLELLSALKWFVVRQSPIQAKFDLHGPTDTAAAMKDAFAVARAAIAKAEGKK